MELLAMPSTASAPKNAEHKKEQPRVRPASGASKRTLERAFQSFAGAAESLEKSYGQLHAEVLRLRFALERTNSDLASSLEENAGMRRYLARILENLPCGVLVVDQQGQPRMMNPEARRLLSGVHGNLRTTDIAVASGAAVVPAISDALIAVVAPLALEAANQCNELAPEAMRGLLEASRAEGAAEQERQIPTEQGMRTIGLACAVLGEGKSAGAAGESVFILRDVTEERRRAAERETARRKESLAEMATLLAHEIRNPLGSLELFAGLLADAAANQPDLRRWTDHIQAGLRSLSATVNNVLQFHSEPAPQLAPVNLGRLMRESVEFLRPLARQAGLRIDLQNALGELEAPADAHRLQQVFFNLSLNAFRAMALGGTLEVHLQWADLDNFSNVQIDFADNGRGIAPEHLQEMYEPGFTTNAGNPGLGLAVCRTVMQQHGGSIRACSEMGKGTTFSLILPCGGRGA
jgi:signal transduction histidine kinase